MSYFNLSLVLINREWGMSQNLTKMYAFSKEIILETRNRSRLGIVINMLFSLLLFVTTERLFVFNIKFFSLVFLILLTNLLGWILTMSFADVAVRRWHLIFSMLIVILGALWSTLIYKTLDLYYTDIRTVTLIHMIFSGLMATASYSLALSQRDYYVFGVQIMIAPLLFFFWNNAADFNSGFLFATFGMFFVLISLVRRDSARQWCRVLQQKNELRLIINSFPGGVSLIKDNKYIYVNEFISRYTGISADQFTNQPVGFARKDNSFVSVYEEFLKSNESSMTRETPLLVGGALKLYLLILKRKDEDQSIIIAITLDIHEQRKNEMALQSAAKMAALGEMATSLAHEVNNPLAVISAQVTQLMKGVQASILPDLEKSKFDAGLQRVYKTVFRISEIIKGLRQISRNDESDPKQIIKVQDILDGTISLCETKCHNSGITLNYSSQEETIWMNGHPTQISQVILNLINNSIYALETLSEKWIELSLSVRDEIISIRLKDSGRGIEASLVDKIMTPFFTTKPTGKGTGLGLSISKSIVEQHGGEFYYDAHESNTTFVINIPVSPAPEQPV